MKIQIISDLHQEFGVSELSFGNADLVILVADINLGTKGIEWIKETYLQSVQFNYIFYLKHEMYFNN